MTQEAGPFGMLVNFRSAVGVYDLGADGAPITQVGKLFECPYCLGVWLAFGLAILPESKLSKLLIMWLAISGVQTVLQDLQ